MHYYCRLCGALLHESEVDIKDGQASHIVSSYIKVDGTEGGIIHTGLTLEEY